ncbi:hypothetical protein [Nocardioides sp. URHA0020]|uniref:hypothetical protein n=1 Tax=Nocardioides sp. URHA0020 TaxID=1380392 RepID=UPI0006860A35|nr:hypothetical protein [Nocardioides sp. URHA0020]
MTTGPENPYGEPQQPPHQPPYPQPAQPYQQQPQPPYGYGYPQPYRQPAPKHPSSTTAMVLGLIAVVGVLSCGGVTLVLAPFAWAIGGRAVKEIDAAPPGTYSGRDEATIGRVTGIIGTVLLILGIIAVIAIIGLVVASDSSSSTTYGDY